MKFIALFCFFFVESPLAMSVSWQGSTAVMTTNQFYLTDWLIAYSMRSDTALAARFMRMTMKDGSEMSFYAPQIDYLVKRWNAPNFQANIYVNAGYGAESSPGRYSQVAVAALDADVESRELYAAGKFQGNWVRRGPEVYQTELRLGMAPYKASFEEIASWLIVSFQSNPKLIRKYAFTPMLRLFYKSSLLEVGASTEGDWMLNTMLHF
jgi:hypothetical protein